MSDGLNTETAPNTKTVSELNRFDPKTEPHFDEFIGSMGSKFGYTYFKEICSPRSPVYPKI